MDDGPWNEESTEVKRQIAKPILGTQVSGPVDRNQVPWELCTPETPNPGPCGLSTQTC